MAAPPVAKAVNADLSNAACTRNVGLNEFINTQMSPINDSSFRDAVDQSLANNGLLASKASKCRYVIDAIFGGIFFPTLSLGTAPAFSNIEYSVSSKEDGHLIYQETVHSSYEDGGIDGDNLHPNEKGKKLYEGIIRKNLILFVTRFIQSQN